jgi:hypothetical protein
VRIPFHRRTALLIVAAIAQAGVSDALAQVAPAEPRLYDITVAAGIQDGRPAGVARAFRPGTNPIFVWFRHEGLAPGAQITSVWYYLEPAEPLRIADTSVTIQSPADWGQFNLQLGPGKQWPLGQYRVTVLVEGKPLAEARFEITLATGPAGRAEARVHVSQRGSFRVAVPTGWTLRDDLPHADAQMKTEPGDGLIEITSGPTSIRLDPISYAAGWESVSLGSGRLRTKRGGRQTTVAGEPAYEGLYEGEGVLARVAFVGSPNRFFVLTGVFPAKEFERLEPAFDDVLKTFALSAR